MNKAFKKMSCSIVYIGATWCKTCKVIKPALEELAKRFQVEFIVKDLDEDFTEEEKSEITKVPTVRLLKGEHVVDTYNMNQVESVTNWLKTNVKVVSDDSF